MIHVDCIYFSILFKRYKISSRLLIRMYIEVHVWMVIIFIQAHKSRLCFAKRKEHCCGQATKIRNPQTKKSQPRG